MSKVPSVATQAAPQRKMAFFSCVPVAHTKSKELLANRSMKQTTMQTNKQSCKKATEHRDWAAKGYSLCISGRGGKCTINGLWRATARCQSSSCKLRQGSTMEQKQQKCQIVSGVEKLNWFQKRWVLQLWWTTDGWWAGQVERWRNPGMCTSV